MPFKVGDNVVLKTFNSTKRTPGGCSPEENYWSLISETGEVVQDPKEPGLYREPSHAKRICVKFHKNLTQAGLVNHNNVPNSLWILESDLEKINKS